LGWCNFGLFSFVSGRSLKEGFDICLRLYDSPFLVLQDSFAPGWPLNSDGWVSRSVRLAIHSCTSCISIIFSFPPQVCQHISIRNTYFRPLFHNEGRKKFFFKKIKKRKSEQRICIRNFQQFFTVKFQCTFQLGFLWLFIYIRAIQFYLFGASP